MVRPYLNEVGGNVENDVSLFTGGLQTYEDKAFIESNQLPYVMNLRMQRPPCVETRPSRKSLAQNDAEGPLFAEETEVQEMISVGNGEFMAISRYDNHTYFSYIYKGAGGYLTNTTISLIPNGEYGMCYVTSNTYRFVYIGNNSYKARYDLSTNPLETDRFKTYADHFGFPCWHKERLWLANTINNTVEWSNTYLPDDFLIGPDDPQTPTRYGDSGERYFTAKEGHIVSIVSFDDKLIVLCEHTIHAIYGWSGEDDNENYFTPVDLNNNLGCHSRRCVAIGGGRLFWLGDDYEVYEYTGAAMNILSRPNASRYTTISGGSISGIWYAEDEIDYNGNAQMTATSTMLYFNVGIHDNSHLFIFDIYNKLWWCEDGEFTCIANYSEHVNTVLLAKPNGDILKTYEQYNDEGVDYVYDYATEKIVEETIEYELHTRVFGADGTDLRKSLSKIWLQARANATVYLNDIWTSFDKWQQVFGHGQGQTPIEENYRKIGELKYDQQTIQSDTPEEIYRSDTYEQQSLYVEKMYGQRLNTFQVIIKGKGPSKFYLMKRVWRAR